MSRRKKAVDDKLRRTFQKCLLTWYAANKRDLPWRNTANPYNILVSEIMLQQTQVERVIPKYEEFLQKYPTLEALARAPVEEVRQTWYPLGYNIRPLRLHSIAREAVEKYGGKIPQDPETLQSLKGIGRYTAGAVRSFAFGHVAPILDTNVRRVLHRVFIGQGDAKRYGLQKDLWELSEALIPARQAYDFNQGLMDFGATVCTARKPVCLICPMQDICKAFPCTP
ncbi:MAG TPA: A/G-specific adenine glycosylase [Candidatus Tectomicrobia bacterium]|nr:A/G-specific adenine glycosylase [Candidatus Tectomicrobia bacterium]